jgi:2-keto-4-pentenoate hydratase/2-oxohepta-3-ene-1,7-dioic acid hydratase in catechol pathway
MRYATFSLPTDPTPRLGAVFGDRVVDVSAAIASRWPGSCPGTLLELVQNGPENWRRAASLLQGGLQTAAVHRMPDVRCHAPIPRPAKNVFCLGLNYVSHAQEASRARDRAFKLPDVPVFFSKAPTTVNGPFDDVIWDSAATDQVDYEAELGVVIGVTGKNIARADALDHVFGYTVVNDVSARDLQFVHGQWFKGKCLDGFCPMGPVVVTADEFGDAQTKRILLRVNGATKQDGTTADMIFPVDVTIESLSKGMTLEAGDLIATGTPAGVGLGRTPPEYLKDGDIVETEIEGIGIMRNRIVCR